MNKLLTTFAVTGILLLIIVLIKAITIYPPVEINCHGSIIINSPSNSNYLFEGVVSVKRFRDGKTKISISGESFFDKEDKKNRNLLFRNYILQTYKRNKGAFEINDIREVKHPQDTMDKKEVDSILQDIFGFENKIFSIRKLPNAYLFGEQPVPSFICVSV
ncbi:hypothetical protein F6R83_08960 [Citrobacter amalonaticus]|nr:hypothetical protein [Citrobacter amalonaticus]